MAEKAIERYEWVARLRDLAERADHEGVFGDAFEELQQQCTPDTIIALCGLAAHGRIIGWRKEGNLTVFMAASAMADKEFVEHDAELVRDALRWRWLKRAMGDGNTPDSETAYTTVTCLPSEKWDAAIDTAIAQADGGEG